MDLKCEKCGKKIGEGEIKPVQKEGREVKKLYIKGYIEGELHRNKSNDPEKWTFLCSDCQVKK